MASSQRRSPARKAHERPIYHFVAHTHWDHEWYKPFEAFRGLLVECVDEVLRMLHVEEGGLSHFMLDGQTSVLDDYLEIRPEKAGELTKRVAEGTVSIGPWYTLPDVYLASAEALIRNLQRGDAICRQFGKRMNVGYIPDSFGHIAAMPSIFSGFGINNAVVYRGFGGEPGQESSEYIWQAPDGTRATMHHLYPDGYSGGYMIDEEREIAVRNMLDARAKTNHRLLLIGGDHHFPMPEIAGFVKRFGGNTSHAIVRQSTLEEYMRAIEPLKETFPLVEGELHFGYRYAFAVSSGVYSSRMPLKQANWRIQRLFERYAEPLNAICYSLGKASYEPLLRQGLKYLLQNQAHDSICGCSIDAVHTEMETRFAKAGQIGDYIVERCSETLIQREENEFGDDEIITVFNPSLFERSDPIRTSVDFYLKEIIVGLNPDVKPAPKIERLPSLTITDNDGNNVKYQIVKQSEEFGLTCRRHNYPKQTLVERFEILLDAGVQSGLSLQKFRVQNTAPPEVFDTSLNVTQNILENEYVRVEVISDGSVELTDKRSGEVFTQINIFEDGGDAGDEYNYSYPVKDTVVLSTETHAMRELREQGPVRGAIEVRTGLNVPVSTTRESRSHETVFIAIATKIYLYEHSPLVEFETTIRNTACNHRLRAIFPSGIKTKKTIADEHFALIEREDTEYDPHVFSIEVPASVHPMQRFVTVHDERRALTVFSYGLPEYELKHESAGTLALTLLRSVGSLSGSDLITRPGGDAGWKNDTPGAQCLGEHVFRYAALVHTPGNWEEVLRCAEKFHTPRIAMKRKSDAEIPDTALVSSDNPVIVLSALKTADAGNGIVIRLYNPLGDERRSTLQFARRVHSLCSARLDETPGRKIALRKGSVQLTFKPYEIKTLIASVTP